jgi:hypothetical protein
LVPLSLKRRCDRTLGPPDMRLGGGILTYYGDDVLAFESGLRVGA